MRGGSKGAKLITSNLRYLNKRSQIKTQDWGSELTVEVVRKKIFSFIPKNFLPPAWELDLIAIGRK